MRSALRQPLEYYSCSTCKHGQEKNAGTAKKNANARIERSGDLFGLNFPRSRSAMGENPVHFKAGMAEYRGRKVTLNKPVLTPKGPKKRSVYVKNEKGNVVKVNFGDPNMKIKKSDPARRKSFRARHNCASPGPKTKARYWSCKAW